MTIKQNKTHKIGVIALVILLAIMALLALCGLLALKKHKIILNYKDLGIPYLDVYTDEQLNSRLSFDMTVYEGKLYVGGGDYDANTGPVYVMSYNLESGSWEKSDEPLDDEQIKRYRVLGGKLVTLGTDPREDWELGNYYLLGENGWETLRVLPSGIHCFDAIEWNGDLFFGLGVKAGSFPAARFDGENYTAVKFFKDGEMLDTSFNSIVRVYNFFEYKSKLFAFLTLDKTDQDGNTLYFMDLYVYDGEHFVFLHGSLPACDLCDVITTDESLFFVMNNTLLATNDLTQFKAVGLGEDVKAVDVIKQDGRVYALGWREVGKDKFEVSVFEENDGAFTKCFGILTRAAAGSFCKDGSNFYISLGNRGDTAPDMGRVIKINLD